jgi:hypothetical protein
MQIPQSHVHTWVFVNAKNILSYKVVCDPDLGCDKLDYILVCSFVLSEGRCIFLYSASRLKLYHTFAQNSNLCKINHEI